MNKEAVVLEVVGKVSGRQTAFVKPEHELVADLGIDSPKGLQLLAELEDRLKLEISDEDAARMNKVADILEFVRTR